MKPVVFDVDDFCDKWNCLPELDALKERYPDFKVTLFTIPGCTSQETLDEAGKRKWVEMAVHGITHVPNEELKSLDHVGLERCLLNTYILDQYAKGFRPPGWYITPEHIAVLNDLGMWVAIHKRDETTLGPLCRHGYYVCDNAHTPYWHAHTSGPGQLAHVSCGNGIAETLPMLLERWPRDQKFAKVSESLIYPQETPR